MSYPPLGQISDPYISNINLSIKLKADKSSQPQNIANAIRDNIVRYMYKNGVMYFGNINGIRRFKYIEEQLINQLRRGSTQINNEDELEVGICGSDAQPYYAFAMILHSVNIIYLYII